MKLIASNVLNRIAPRGMATKLGSWFNKRAFPALLWTILLVLPCRLAPGNETLPLAMGKAPLTTATPLNVPRQMHGAAVLGDFIYVVGGNIASGYTETVEFAPILPDGSLGQWQPTAPLPQQRGYIENSTLALNDVLYVAGGHDESQKERDGLARKINTIAWAKPAPDGSLAQWTESPPWPGPGVNCMVTVVTPGYLHILGGLLIEGNPSDKVHSGRIAPEGGVSEWVEAPSLPIPLWFHSAAVLGGRVWIWGGLVGKTNRTTSRQMFSCPVLSNGRLGPWQEEIGSEIPVAYYSAACTSVNNHLITVCPRLTGGINTSDIWFSAFEGQRPGRWQRMISELSATRYLPVAPDFRRGLAYVAGGRKQNNSISRDVFILRFTGATGTTGFDQSYFAARTPSASSSAARALLPGVDDSLPVPTPIQAASRTAPATPAAGGGTPPSAGLGNTGTEEIPPGFYSLDQARRIAEGPPRRPMLLYFHHDSTEQCVRQKRIVSQPDFAALSERAAFAWIEVRDSPQLVQQLGVFKVPAWILYNSSGSEAGRVLDVLTLDQLRAGLDEVR